MESILDMLKLLDYESKFIRVKGFKPISKVYFAVQHSNPSEQFLYFISLVSWLLSINNHQVANWNKYDDPMTASQTVISELKKLGIEVDVSPNKLKSGFGDSVCQVLMALCDITMQNKFKFRQPTIKDDGGNFGDDEEGDDMGTEYEGNADVADMAIRDEAKSDADDIDEELEFGNGGAPIID